MIKILMLLIPSRIYILSKICVFMFLKVDVKKFEKCQAFSIDVALIIINTTS